MEFGLDCMTQPDTWKDLVVAEDLGFTHAWMIDSPLICSDAYVALALAAEHTKRIKLGVGVAIPSNRIEPVAAHSIATINLMAPGRTILGVGSGFTGRYTLGLPPISPRRLRQYVENCRRLLRGEEILYHDPESGRDRWIKFLHPAHGFINIKDTIPIHLAASAPRTLKLVGELADGWLTFIDTPENLKKKLAAVRQAGAAVGRRLDGFPTAVLTASCVLRRGESLASPRVVEWMGPWAAVVLHAIWERSVVVGEPTGPLKDLYTRYHDEYVEKMKTPPDRRYQEVHEGHMFYLKPGEERYITEGLIGATTLVGTGEEIIARLKALEAVGVTQVMLSPPRNAGREMMEEFSREVISRY